MECRAGALRGAFCAQVAQGGATDYLAGCWLGIAKGRSGCPGQLRWVLRRELDLGLGLSGVWTHGDLGSD